MTGQPPFRTVFLDPDFRRNPKTDVFCCVCQKDIKGAPRFYARVVEAGACAVHPADWGLVPEGYAEDYGVHPVGNDCARRIGKEWFSTAREPAALAPEEAGALPALRLVSTDNGNCRVYYRSGRRLLCFQLGSRGEFDLFRCSRDGEPEYEVPHSGKSLDRLPQDDDATSREFREWWTSRDMTPEGGASFP